MRYSVDEIIARQTEAWKFKHEDQDDLAEAYAYAASSISPYRYSGTGDPWEGNDPRVGRQPNYYRWSASLLIANSNLQNSTVSNFFPTNVRWAIFKPAPSVKIGDAVTEGELQKAQVLAFRYLHDSNFDTAIGAFIQDYTTAGIAFMGQHFDENSSRFLYTPISQAHMAIDVDNEGEPMAFYHHAVYSWDEMVEKFGLMEMRAIRRPDDKTANQRNYRVLRACLYDPIRMQWEASHILHSGPGADHAPHRMGDVSYFAREQAPFLMARWAMAPGEIYGHSPVMDIMPIYLLANHISECIAESTAYAAKGGVYAISGASAQSWRDDDIEPGMIIRLHNIDEFKRIETPTTLPSAQLDLERMEMQIQHAMLWDRRPMKARGNPDTATEVLMEDEHRQRAFGIAAAQLTRLGQGVLRYILLHIEREHDIGRLENSQITLTSRLAVNQDSVDFEREVEAYMNIKTLVGDGQAALKIDGNGLVDRLWRLSGGDVALLRDDDDMREAVGGLKNMAQQAQEIAPGAPQGGPV